MVSYMTFYSPSISLEMWSLWPLMIEALNDWAIDYFDSESINQIIRPLLFCFFDFYSRDLH